ncbi:phosphonate ABC transporter, permease protein PhnE [Leptolyngbya sp. CCNP1308]|uniref:phosphonate ABC transporter, permease protein PhnE n=1 Tax=Leptolyngbya sp. CCNP1308 TaxID=3110255 RepID=UPI002B200ABD|nr:phosphonate ABC transporter, permease protein PhnE [Leptolyngbya sp. CCNP1308]MEA5452843.1 phosphonate ABC transporter, permease protein PhnE [Leptolyngbya sp. CCNP1308]
MQTELHSLQPPVRWKRPSPFLFVLGVVMLSIFLHGVSISGLTAERMIRGVFRLYEFLDDAFPPDLTRLPNILKATLETFEMALVGTVFGAFLSLPLALLAAKNTTPYLLVYRVTRFFIGFLRAIPDLIWGLIFIVVVGLGPGPGILAIAVDVMGFCGRFFAERIEEIEPGTVDALRALGASQAGVIIGAILPETSASFVASTLFSLESSVRSAVVLGLVGAGGIGVELATSMQLLRYDQALTIILVIFLVVIAVEQVSSAIRRRLI